MTASLAVAPDLADITRPGVLWWDGATVVEHEPRLDTMLAAAQARVRDATPPESTAVRTMYRRVGLDPTKTRPSNEALLRRVHKGLPFPRVNAMVDVVNWCSLELQLPYGIYDRRRLAGAVTLRLGAAGEEYAGIRKDTVHVGGRLTLADAQGPFGNPTSDSARTMVTAETRDALVVIFAPAEVSPARLSAALDLTAARLADIVGGAEAGRWTCA